MREGDYVDLRRACEESFNACLEACTKRGIAKGVLLTKFSYEGLQKFNYGGLCIVEGKVLYWEGENDLDAENELSFDQWNSN